MGDFQTRGEPFPFFCSFFFSLKNVFSSLLQISKFKEESNLKLRHVNQLLKIKLSI